MTEDREQFVQRGASYQAGLKAFDQFAAAVEEFRDRFPSLAIEKTSPDGRLELRHAGRIYALAHSFAAVPLEKRHHAISVARVDEGVKRPPHRRVLYDDAGGVDRGEALVEDKTGERFAEVAGLTGAGLVADAEGVFVFLMTSDPGT